MNKLEIKIIKQAKRYEKELNAKLTRASKGLKIHEEDATIWIGDISDYIAACKLISKKKYYKAYEYVNELDTSAREEFDDGLWDLLDEYYDMEE